MNTCIPVCQIVYIAVLKDEVKPIELESWETETAPSLGGAASMQIHAVENNIAVPGRRVDQIGIGSIVGVDGIRDFDTWAPMNISNHRVSVAVRTSMVNKGVS